ncbi:24654_t:CDS:1 [Cetraspora pellucida]|uniref:Histone H1 n=1 Tax=Cetraspora pellucida TaxID=1433469 RepID=A0A9N9CEG2_9GLOM|nr:24654_t:CDS:1 [Cetraspora pellucida]
MSSKAKANTVKPKRPPYEEMIREAIIALKDRKGSSRPAIKKYITTTYQIEDNPTMAQSFRKALKKGVDKEIFTFYNGPKGTIKLVKKDAEKKPRSVTKASDTKDEAAKKTKSKVTKPKPVKKTSTVEKKVSKPAPVKKTPATKSTTRGTKKGTKDTAKSTTRSTTRSATRSTRKSPAATKSAAKDVGKSTRASTSRKAKAESPKTKATRKRATRAGA